MLSKLYGLLDQLFADKEIYECRCYFNDIEGDFECEPSIRFGSWFEKAGVTLRSLVGGNFRCFDDEDLKLENADAL